MVKIKFFKMEPENSEEISNFIDTVKLLDNGLVVSDGKVGVMYKNKDEIGMSKDEQITALSGELAKSQKQYIISDGLARAYKETVKLIQGKIDTFNHNVEVAKADLEQFELANKENLETKARFILENTKKKTQPSEEVLTAQSEYNTDKAMYDAKVAGYQGIITENTVASANTLGDLKNELGFLKDAEDARDRAQVFIGTTLEFINELSK